MEAPSIFRQHRPSKLYGVCHRSDWTHWRSACLLRIGYMLSGVLFALTLIGAISLLSWKRHSWAMRIWLPSAFDIHSPGAYWKSIPGTLDPFVFKEKEQKTFQRQEKGRTAWPAFMRDTHIGYAKLTNSQSGRFASSSTNNVIGFKS